MSRYQSPKPALSRDDAHAHVFCREHGGDEEEGVPGCVNSLTAGHPRRMSSTSLCCFQTQHHISSFGYRQHVNKFSFSCSGPWYTLLLLHQIPSVSGMHTLCLETMNEVRTGAQPSRMPSVRSCQSVMAIQTRRHS